jgi:hypothetical protein
MVCAQLRFFVAVNNDGYKEADQGEVADNGDGFVFTAGCRRRSLYRSRGIHNSFLSGFWFTGNDITDAMPVLPGVK